MRGMWGSETEDLSQYWYCVNEGGFLSFDDWRFEDGEDEGRVGESLR